MKIVDEKGKLFGKINVIDLLVIILVIAAAVVVIFKVTGMRDNGGMGNTTKIVYVAKVTSVERPVYEELAKYVNKDAGLKDQLMADGALVSGYVVDYYAEPHVNYNADETGRVTTSIEQGDNARLDLYFTIEAEVENSEVNKVGTQEVRTGKSHIVKTTHFEFSYSIITSCDQVSQ